MVDTQTNELDVLLELDDRKMLLLTLREHIAFLREQLEEKRSWYEAALQREEEAHRDTLCKYEAMREERDRLKIALAETCQEIYYHNEDKDGDYNTDNDWLDAQRALTVVPKTVVMNNGEENA